MSKKSFVKIGLLSILSLCLLSSCSSKNKQIPIEPSVEEDLPVTSELAENSKNHKWFYFTENSFEEIDLPQNVPEKVLRPWTEALRIASAGSVPSRINSTEYDAYAVVNRCGIMAFKDGKATLFEDKSLFSLESADCLVFSGTTPVFYLYRNSFFNEDSGTELKTIQSSRPFLVEFDPDSKLCYPLVSYSNLNLKDNDEISGFFWNGTKWACSVKSILGTGVEFSYFAWEPILSLTDLSPALNKDVFVFSSSSEAEYRGLNSPHLFSDAPSKLKGLMGYIPSSVSFYVSYRDESGTTPMCYFQEGKGEVPLNAKAVTNPSSGYSACVFEDGTTYVKKENQEDVSAFRLPKLPGGYKYGDVCISGNTLVCSWEESEFYKTGRSGFIQVDLYGLLK